jgi:hypothetical protein
MKPEARRIYVRCVDLKRCEEPHAASLSADTPFIRAVRRAVRCPGCDRLQGQLWRPGILGRSRFCYSGMYGRRDLSVMVPDVAYMHRRQAGVTSGRRSPLPYPPCGMSEQR